MTTKNDDDGLDPLDDVETPDDDVEAAIQRLQDLLDQSYEIEKEYRAAVEGKTP